MEAPNINSEETLLYRHKPRCSKDLDLRVIMMPLYPRSKNINSLDSNDDCSAAKLMYDETSGSKALTEQGTCEVDGTKMCSALSNETNKQNQDLTPKDNYQEKDMNNNYVMVSQAAQPNLNVEGVLCVHPIGYSDSCVQHESSVRSVIKTEPLQANGGSIKHGDLMGCEVKTGSNDTKSLAEIAHGMKLNNRSQKDSDLFCSVSRKSSKKRKLAENSLNPGNEKKKKEQHQLFKSSDIKQELPSGKAHTRKYAKKKTAQHAMICPESGCSDSTQKKKHLKKHKSLHSGKDSDDVMQSGNTKSKTTTCTFGRNHEPRPCEMKLKFVCPWPRCDFSRFDHQKIMKHFKRDHARQCTRQERTEFEKKSRNLDSKPVCKARNNSNKEVETKKGLCEKCGVICRGKSPDQLLKKHQEEHHASMVLHSICPSKKCTYTSSSHYSLYIHVKRRHKKEFSRKQLKRFSSVENVERIYIPNPHNGSSFMSAPCPPGMIRWWFCPIKSCEKSDQSKRNIKAHLFVHRDVLMAHQIRNYCSKIGLPSKFLPLSEEPKKQTENVTDCQESETNPKRKQYPPVIKTRKVCPYCDKEFFALKSHEYLNDHLRIYHTKTIEVYYCPIKSSCQFTHIYASRVRSHILIRHARSMSTEQIQMYIHDHSTPIPRKTQTNKSYKRKHEKVEATKLDTAFTCEICGKIFASQANLKRHNTMGHSVQDKCPV